MCPGSASRPSPGWTGGLLTRRLKYLSWPSWGGGPVTTQSPSQMIPSLRESPATLWRKLFSAAVLAASFFPSLPTICDHIGEGRNTVWPVTTESYLVAQQLSSPQQTRTASALLQTPSWAVSQSAVPFLAHSWSRPRDTYSSTWGNTLFLIQKGLSTVFWTENHSFSFGGADSQSCCEPLRREQKMPIQHLKMTTSSAQNRSNSDTSILTYVTSGYKCRSGPHTEGRIPKTGITGIRFLRHLNHLKVERTFGWRVRVRQGANYSLLIRVCV